MAINPTDVEAINFMVGNAEVWLTKLNERERRFIADMRDLLRRGQEFTQRMVDKIEEIHIKLP